MMDPEISIIIPVYGVESYLARCIDSVLCQTFSDIEIILIDDGSPDRCGEICDDYAAKDSRIRVIHKENGGISDARNAGMDIARGKYLGFVDSDDYIDSKMYATLYDLLVSNDADISVCNIYNCYNGNASVRPVSFSDCFTCDREKFGYYTLSGALPSYMCNKLFRRESLGKIRFQTGKCYEDILFIFELFPEINKVAVTPDPLYYYWIRKNSTTTMPYTKSAWDMIDAYDFVYASIKKTMPSLLPVAEFRLHYGRFIVFDRILFLSDYKKMPEYKVLKIYLKKNWLKIAGNRFFSKKRRLAILLLKLNVHFYAFILKRTHPEIN